MAEFLRPDVMRLLRRWREVLVALAVIALGIWIAAAPGPIVEGFGWIMVGLGAIALVPAMRRARFQASGDGPGVVTIDERRVIYMGPTHGGAVALDELDHLSIRRNAEGAAAWLLVEQDTLLTIPVDASGAEALFDAFTALPGLSSQTLLAARDLPQPGTTRLWVRHGDLPPGRTLTR